MPSLPGRSRAFWIAVFGPFLAGIAYVFFYRQAFGWHWRASPDWAPHGISQLERQACILQQAVHDIDQRHRTLYDFIGIDVGTPPAHLTTAYLDLQGGAQAALDTGFTAATPRKGKKTKLLFRDEAIDPLRVLALGDILHRDLPVTRRELIAQVYIALADQSFKAQYDSRFLRILRQVARAEKDARARGNKGAVAEDDSVSDYWDKKAAEGQTAQGQAHIMMAKVCGSVFE